MPQNADFHSGFGGGKTHGPLVKVLLELAIEMIDRHQKASQLILQDGGPAALHPARCYV